MRRALTLLTIFILLAMYTTFVYLGLSIPAPI